MHSSGRPEYEKEQQETALTNLSITCIQHIGVRKQQTFELVARRCELGKTRCSIQDPARGHDMRDELYLREGALLPRTRETVRARGRWQGASTIGTVCAWEASD